MSRRWRILIVGLGGTGQRHMRVLRELLGDNVTFLAYRVRGRSALITPQFELDTSTTVEKKFNIRCFKTLNAALAERPDAVFICNPTRFHVPTAQAAVKAGIPVFSEKPLSDRWTGVEKLLQRIDQKKLPTLMGLPLRFHPALQWMKKQLTEKRLGALQSAELWVHSYLPTLHPYEKFEDTYIARKDLGGGVILTEIHEIDYAYWLFGMPRRVTAVGGTVGAFKIEVEDTATLLWECGTGKASFPVHVQMSMVQQPAGRGCRINGRKGQMVWEGGSEVRVYDAATKTWNTQTFLSFNRSQLIPSEINEFLQSIEKRRRSAVDLRTGAHSLRIALAAKKSLSTGQTVTLDQKALCKL